MRQFIIFGLVILASTSRAQDIPDAAKTAKGLDSALASLKAPTRDTRPLPPAEALKRFKLRPGYAVDLISAEPDVRQPLNLQFDARGRMWVTQYVQYPFPKGLKVVEYDQYIRAKFDKTPLPPPRGDKGADKVTIHEDADGDGTYEKVTAFVDGLNIATAALPGRGGVWVMNPPYLLFYPVNEGEDRPAGDPVVHLSGFGLEDTHAVANSLAWGPDGWIYGAQGSTCTAKVKVEVSAEQKGTTDFLGQAVWRYHPERHVFEIFAEGGGNTFGVEFDDAGRLFSGTNWNNHRGFHYVQGGYYVKGWGKHGPLTNPYAFGFFEHMPHTGDAKRLTHTMAVYGGGLMTELTGKLIGANSLMSRVQVTRLEPVGSTYRTVEEEPLMTTDDGWFRPVDVKVGPDGAIYVADFYENRISHVDPRDTWDRANGRIWRIRPVDWKAAKAEDLPKKSTDELLEKLKDPNRHIRWTAVRLLGERSGDTSVFGHLREYFGLRDNHPSALEALWVMHLLRGVRDEVEVRACLRGQDPMLRAWAVRLLGDAREAASEEIEFDLLKLAVHERDAQVRSQLAASLKRLPFSHAGRVLQKMLQTGGDEKDPHVPLLLWWAMEQHLSANVESVARHLMTPVTWESVVVRETVAPRLARLLVTRNGVGDQRALLGLFRGAPGEDERKILLAGVAQALEGGAGRDLLPELREIVIKSGDRMLAARLRDKAALAELTASIADDNPKLKEQRIKAIELLGQLAPPGAALPLLDVATTSQSHAVRKAALAALSRFADPRIGPKLAAAYASMPKDQGVRPAAISALLARKASSLDLLRAVEAGTIPKADLSGEQLDRLRQSNDKAVAAMLQKVFGQVARPTTAEKERAVARLKSIVSTGGGDAVAGKAIYTARCAACHALFGEGAQVGPDLTPYDRRNAEFLAVSIVDPSAAVREEYTNFRIDTADGETLIGLIAERGPDSVTLVDATQQKTVVAKKDVEQEQALSLSMMPEGLLDGLTDDELRNLFAYLQREKK